ncbi:hypothetical protein PFISCL1PPCAC_1297 [Pristionchus fissidentatus]|uniref:Uncharacterized protein n=1 Tax=Pristionchus fissidentatus TaxID=1538716 RepID=A0AAV5UV17_9BILA|nr:hypothetical protein PFISCL1PPCAC_1297 [Pristionchus fissidentatus]
MRLFHSTHKERSSSAPIVSGLFHSISLSFPSGTSKIVVSPFLSSLSSSLQFIDDSISNGHWTQNGGSTEALRTSLIWPFRDLYEVFIPRAPLKDLMIVNDESSVAIDRY